jgi:hypothetical protein
MEPFGGLLKMGGARLRRARLGCAHQAAVAVVLVGLTLALSAMHATHPVLVTYGVCVLMLGTGLSLAHARTTAEVAFMVVALTLSAWLLHRRLVASVSHAAISGMGAQLHDVAASVLALCVTAHTGLQPASTIVLFALLLLVPRAGTNPFVETGTTRF